MRTVLALAALAALAACASTAGTPVPMSPLPTEPPGREFRPTGEVVLVGFGGKSAAFNAYRVVGPTVNISLTRDGAWGGNLGTGLGPARDVRLVPSPGRLDGVGVNLSIRRQGDVIDVGGMWFDYRVHFEISPKKVAGRLGRSFELVATGPGRYQGTEGQLTLSGDAANLADPTMPQLVLALVAVLHPGG